MEKERNNIPEQVNICKIGFKENIDKDERDNILEILKTPWIGDGWRLEDASENHKKDREIVMAEVKESFFRLSLHQGIFQDTKVE